MKSYEEIVDDTRPGHTFSSLSEYEHWAVAWCARCRHQDGCPIIDAALINTGLRPAEWVPTQLPFGPFRCTEFENAE